MGSSAMNSNLVEFGKKNYSKSKSDLFAMFIECWNKRTKYNGCNAMITMQSWMFLSSYENMRSSILNKYTISHLMHMENMVLGIAFGTAATLFWNRGNEGFAGTYNYVKYNSIKKNRPLNFPDKEYRFSQINQELFKKISGAPIAYWAKDGIIEAFMKGIPLGQLTVVRNGMKTGDNNRFLRYWWEIEDYKLNISAKSADEAINSMKKWFPYNKGGELRKWYGNNEFVVNWENGGEEVFNAAKKDGRNVQDYPMDMKFKPSVTWSLITSAKPTFRYKVSNLSDIAGMSMYKANERILYYLGFCNTSIALEMLEMLAPSVNSQAGDIARLPIITNDKYDLQINSLVEDNIDIAKANWNSFEVSWDFLRNPMIRDFSSIAEACKQWEKEDKILFNQMKLNEEELNRIFIDIYNLDGVVNSEINDKDITFQRSSLEYNIKEYISYAIGCMFGRYSLDSAGLVYAGGDFDETRYSKFIPYRSNVIPITDQEYFSDDILNKFVEFVAVCFGKSTLEKNLNFIAQVLDENSATSRETIRKYFVNDFFKEHCNRYSVKGSGKRPIYWLYDSGRQDGFKALVYMHRYTEDTTGKVRVDYLHKVQKIYEKIIYGLQENIANSKDAKEIAKLQKQIEKLTKQLKECKEYDERLGHMALERVPVDLDDGVKVNYLKVQTDSKGKLYQILAEI